MEFTSDTASLVLAAFGATTGLLAIGFQLWTFVATGARLKIQLFQAWLASHSEELINIEIMNIGRFAVTISTVSIQLDGTDVHIPVHRFQSITKQPYFDFPVRVEAHDLINLNISKLELKQSLVQNNLSNVSRIRIQIHAANGKKLVSKWRNI